MSLLGWNFWGGFEKFSKLHEFLTSPFKIFGLQSHVYSLSSVVNDWKFLRNVFLSCLTDDNRRRARKSARAHIYVAAATEIKVCDSSCASWGSCGASARQRRIFTRKIRAKMATTCWFPRAPSDGTLFCQKNRRKKLMTVFYALFETPSWGLFEGTKSWLFWEGHIVLLNALM